VKVKENEYGSDWLKELALASSPAQGLEPAEADNNTSELLGDTIIVSHPADRANPNHTGNGLSAPNIARIDESEEDVPEGSGGESRDPSANDQENAGLLPEDPNLENLVQIAPKRGRKNWGPATQHSSRIEGENPELSALVAAQLQNEYQEPCTIQEALTGRDRELWRQAIISEWRSHRRNHTWDLIKRPRNKDVVSSK
jgi:hypothetical protein